MNWAGLLVIGGLLFWWWNNMRLPTPDVGAVPATAGINAVAIAIALAEGYGVDGAIPTVRNNPGDLTDGSGTIRTFPSPQAGWQALFDFLQIIQTGQPSPYSNVVTIADFGVIYTATEQSAWTRNVVWSLNQQGYAVTAESPLAPVLNAN